MIVPVTMRERMKLRACAFRAEHGWEGMAITLTNDHDGLAFAVLIASETAIDAILFMICGLDVAAEVAAIDFRNFAFASQRAAFHFLCHRFAQLVEQHKGRLIGQPQIARDG